MNALIQRYKKIVSKLKILDWLVIIIISGIIGFLVTSSLNQDKWITIEFKVTTAPAYFPHSGETPPYWITDKIRPGDIQYDNLGQKNLEILAIRDWGFQYKETWVTASVKTKYKAKQKKYTYQYQPLEIGRSIDATINGTNIHGIVTAIQGFSDTRPTYDITIKARLTNTDTPYSTFTRGIDPWVAEYVQTGQTMKDASGKTLAEILDVYVTPAERVITTSDGRTVLGIDPLKKDVYLTIKLNVIKQNDTYLFLEDKPIVIGLQFPIYLPKSFLVPVVTQIQ